MKKYISNKTAILTLAGLGCALVAHSATSTWTDGDSTDQWNKPANWGGTAPAFDNQTDLIFNSLTGSQRSRLQGNYTIRSITFDTDFASTNTATYDIETQASTGAIRTLTLEADSGNASITVNDLTQDLSQIRFGRNNMGPVVFASDVDLTVLKGDGFVFKFDSIVEGTGALNLYGGGNAMFTRLNTFSGGVNVNNGTVTAFANPNALGSGAVTLGAVGGAASAALELGSSLTFANDIVVNSGAGAREIQNYDGVEGEAVLSGGTISLGANLTFDISAGSADRDQMTVDHSITGTGGLVKEGAGTLQIGGNNDYTGTTLVNEGVLSINGDNSSATGDVIIASGATLEGTGTVGGATTIQAGGNLGPGNSLGELTFTAALTLDAGSFTEMEIAGTMRGSEYDAINVGGLLTYGGDLIISSDILLELGIYDLIAVDGGETGDFESITLSGAAYSGDGLVQSGDLWTTTIGGQTYTFDQATGDLTVIPEPSALACVSGLLALGYVVMRRRQS
ncbi:autotransporter-associated beta strand repeat-containing protein [Coraliomargarita sp. SDUM461004]|uniref:Autotransporter-associated beta strand repeat-containing protein n=1 Tax=Thalassobacterium sedimentorum TaxID=3041258 RepID=A0ABU1AP38_9BACT|nr:autotransporter-associated beta strand repeat-containing protein [Coraliomargarita sp. SDUM461004]MDQ8195978.1 autotransporter-associated beta strand repeat-containing protein [Coraliomargarita sp. SDUM461004]